MELKVKSARGWTIKVEAPDFAAATQELNVPGIGSHSGLFFPVLYDWINTESGRTGVPKIELLYLYLRNYVNKHMDKTPNMGSEWVVWIGDGEWMQSVNVKEYAEMYPTLYDMVKFYEQYLLECAEQDAREQAATAVEAEASVEDIISETRFAALESSMDRLSGHIDSSVDGVFVEVDSVKAELGGLKSELENRYGVIQTEISALNSGLQQSASDTLFKSGVMVDNKLRSYETDLRAYATDVRNHADQLPVLQDAVDRLMRVVGEIKSKPEASAEVTSSLDLATTQAYRAEQIAHRAEQAASEVRSGVNDLADIWHKDKSVLVQAISDVETKVKQLQSLPTKLAGVEQNTLAVAQSLSNCVGQHAHSELSRAHSALNTQVQLQAQKLAAVETAMAKPVAPVVAPVVAPKEAPETTRALAELKRSIGDCRSDLTTTMTQALTEARRSEKPTADRLAAIEDKLAKPAVPAVSQDMVNKIIDVRLQTYATDAHLVDRLSALEAKIAGKLAAQPVPVTQQLLNARVADAVIEMENKLERKFVTLEEKFAKQLAQKDTQIADLKKQLSVAEKPVVQSPATPAPAPAPLVAEKPAQTKTHAPVQDMMALVHAMLDTFSSVLNPSEKSVAPKAVPAPFVPKQMTQGYDAPQQKSVGCGCESCAEAVARIPQQTPSIGYPRTFTVNTNSPSTGILRDLTLAKPVMQAKPTTDRIGDYLEGMMAQEFDKLMRMISRK